VQRELPGMSPAVTSTASGRRSYAYALSGHDHDPTALRRFLRLGMVSLVSRLAPHERVSARLLLPAAGRSQPGLGSRFRLDQYLHLAVRGPAAASAADPSPTADQLDFIDHVEHEYDNHPVALLLRHLPLVVERVPMAH